MDQVHSFAVVNGDDSCYIDTTKCYLLNRAVTPMPLKKTKISPVVCLLDNNKPSHSAIPLVVAKHPDTNS